MVFSFFKKQSDKVMPERPAAKPRAAEPVAEVPQLRTAAEEAPAPLPEPLPDLEFTNSHIGGPIVDKAMPDVALDQAKAAPNDSEFAIDDFDEDDFTESTVMGIDVNTDIDPLQACVEQVVVLYANGQDVAARSLLETFVRSYRGTEGKRFWMLLFDLLQVSGDRAGFEKLGVDYAEACEMSPPPWRPEVVQPKKEHGGNGQRKIFLQGVLTSDGALPVNELGRLIAERATTHVDCAKLIGCDDEVAGQLAELLHAARRDRVVVTLGGIEPFMVRLGERLVAGEAEHEPSWRLLLELLQRVGTQEQFEERAIDYAVTFELSPPSWEVSAPTAASQAANASRPADDAHFLSGDLKGCRFEDLVAVIEAAEHPILDFSHVRRLDFVSAGQLVNRLAPFKSAGREIVIRSPNHLVAELMAVVGLNKMARIIVPKS